MSSYKGLYVQRLENGTICGVQVEDTAGIGNNISPEVYIERGILPLIDDLPDADEYVQ